MPRVPPPEIPIISWLSPNKSDQGLLEFWNTEVASYTALDVGAAHPNQRQYSGFTLGKQAPVQGDEKWVLRTWVTDETSPDWFNWALKFSGEDNAFPIFIRTYRESRASYTPRVKGTPLGTLYKTVLTNVGSGYSNGAYPSVRFDEPTVEPSSVAIAHGVVNPGGSITEVILDFSGEGYAQNVEFTVASPISGDAATGVAYVQPQIAILVREEAALFPPDSEFYANYLQVTRVYETIPGPTFQGTELDVDGAILTTSTTRKLCADIATGENIDSGTWCKTTKKPTDIDVICEEIVACRPIPGNLMVSTLQDEDGKFIARTQQYIDTSTAISNELLATNIWQREHITDVDGTNLVSWQWDDIRAIPGQEIDEISFPYGENGQRIMSRQLVERATYTRTANGTANANFPSALLVDEKLEYVQNTKLVARKIGTYDEIPVASDQQGLGYFVEYPYDGDPAFPRLTWRFQILRLSASTVADLSACPISGFTSLKLVDQKTEEADELIEIKVVRTYEVLPGKPIPKTEIEKDGKVLESVRTKKDESTITSSETVGGGNWTKTYKEPIGGGVAWEVVESRPIPGNGISSASIDGDQEIRNIATILRDESLITPSSSEAGGFITTVEKDAVSDLVANQVTTTTRWLDKAFYSNRIPDSVIPVEFRAAIPTVTESHILAGTASAAGAMLTGSQLYCAEQQLTKNLYEHRTEDFGSIGFPIIQTNYETTEEYGGGILQVIRTLNNALLTVDQGEDVTRSEVHEIGQSYLWFKETASRYGAAAWPVIPSRLWDENMRVEYDETRQVVAKGTAEDPNPGGIFAWVSEVKGIDTWRSQKINTSKNAPSYVSSATALISYEFKPFKFPGLLTTATFGYYVRSAYAELIQHKLRTWWVNSVTTPTVGPTGSGSDVIVDDIIPDTIIISTLNDITVLAYSGMCLHNDLTTFGVLFWPATTPNYTDYVASWQGFEKVIAAAVTPEKELNVWKIVTESVVMR